VSDEEILQAAMRLMGRLGPGGFTLAEVGREIGIAPATLLQRFGSKRKLMLAVVAQGAAGVGGAFEEALGKTKTPLATLVDLVADCAGFLGKPDELANHLAFLQMDLCDPDFHRHMLEQTRAMQAGFAEFLAAAEAAGEIGSGDREGRAKTLHIVYNGALLVWCVERSGDVREFMRRQFEAVLAPWRAGAEGRGKRRYAK
jgi:AcrR family transcriptional regulator